MGTDVTESSRPHAWVLNLDADIELARATPPRGDDGGGAYTPSSAVKKAIAHHAEFLRRSLLGPRDIVIDETSPEGSAEGFIGRAWCPTNRAVAIMKRAGATPEPHPTHEILRRVNARSFCASLGQTLPGAAFITNVDEAIAKLSSRLSSEHTQWRVKRNFGMAGRGHRKIDSKRITKEDVAAVAAAIRDEGGVQIEPNVLIVRELARHAILRPDGHYEAGATVVQECDVHGQWMRTVMAEGHEGQLDSELTRVAGALHAAGYFGPFGVDAFYHRDLGGGPPAGDGFQPRSEVNARYSMGFAVGFAGRIQR